MSDQTNDLASGPAPAGDPTAPDQLRRALPGYGTPTPAGPGNDPGDDPGAPHVPAQPLGDRAGTQPDGAPADAGGRRKGGRSRRRPERPRSSRRLAPRPAGTRRFLVLGGGPVGSDDLVALDVDSRVLVRLHGGGPVLPDGTVHPLDVVDGTMSAQQMVEDPARPEALLVAGQLERAGVARGRRARRALRAVVAPAEQHLLGFPGSSWPYWEFRGNRPSAAVVTPSRGPMLFVRAEDGAVWSRFGWFRTDNWLPVHDPHVVRALANSGRNRLTGKALTNALGYRPAYLVVAVGQPHDGYCTKQLLAMLPRP